MTQPRAANPGFTYHPRVRLALLQDPHTRPTTLSFQSLLYDNVSPGEEEETKESAVDDDSPGFILLDWGAHMQSGAEDNIQSDANADRPSGVEDNIQSGADADMQSGAQDSGADSDVSDGGADTRQARPLTAIDVGDPC